MTDKIHVTTRAVIIDNNRILLAYDPRNPPNQCYELGVRYYYLPGGHVDHQEKATDALVREIFEESGYSSHIDHFLGTQEYARRFSGDDVCCHTHEINLIFKVNFTDPIPPEMKQQEDHVALVWINLDQLSTIDLRPHGLKTLIPQWLAGKNVGGFNSEI